MGSAGASPAPVGDPPTGIAEATETNPPRELLGDVFPVPSGESPDGTGWSTVLPNTRTSTWRSCLSAFTSARQPSQRSTTPVRQRSDGSLIVCVREPSERWRTGVVL